MNLKNTLSLLTFMFVVNGIAWAQQAAPAPPEAPAEPFGNAFSIFIDGGSFLGVYAEDITKEKISHYGLREAKGVGVTGIVSNSPAEKAGLRKDDVILRFEGENVTSVRKLNRLVSEVAPDQTVRLVINRRGTEQELSVTIAKRNDSADTVQRFHGLQGMQPFPNLIAPGSRDWHLETPGSGDGWVFNFGNNRRIGINTMSLTKQLADYFGIVDGKGVLVTSVAEDSPAAKAGIKAGDVITAVDGEKVEASGDLSREINKKKEGDVSLTIIRNKNQRNITVTPREAPSLIQPGGTSKQTGRRVVLAPIEIPAIPEMNIRIPRIEIPATPEINIELPRIPKVKVIHPPVSQPI